MLRPDPLSGAWLALVAVLSALPLGAQRGASDHSGLFRVGQRAPDLELPTLDGRATRNLAQHEARRTILLLFASW